MKKANIKKYVLYHLRWQSGFFVCYPTLAFFAWLNCPLWFSYFMSGFVGAIVFWFVDKWIFSRKEKVL